MIVAWGIAVLCTLFLSSCKRPEVLDNSTLVNSARNVALTFGPAYVPFLKRLTYRMFKFLKEGLRRRQPPSNKKTDRKKVLYCNFYI